MADQVETRQAVDTVGTDKMRLPGVLPAAGIAIISGVVAWMMLSTGAAPSTSNNGSSIASELAQVADQDVVAAETTLNGSDRFLGQFRQQQRGCPLPLAWVSVSRPAGQTGGTIRLRSGNYFSPVFDLTEAPMRIAIPYPAPYEEGHGTLTALVDGGSAQIALHPVWHTQPGGEGAARQVTWPVTQHCKPSNG